MIPSRPFPWVWFPSLCLVAALGSSGCSRPAPEAPEAPEPEAVYETLSDVYVIDKKYKSMTGPVSSKDFHLASATEPELLWITGYEAVVVDPDGREEKSQEFMCHASLELNPFVHAETFGLPRRDQRLFTLSQGQTGLDFPEGFGLPVSSAEVLSLSTQVLNHNVDISAPDQALRVRHRARVKFRRDRGLVNPMRPLFEMQVAGFVSLNDAPAYFGTVDPDEIQEGASCISGQMATEGNHHVFQDPQGQRFTSHWIVPPGRQENRTLVTKQLGLRFDTTIHYIAAHLHPFAESLSLRDLTTGETVFVSRVDPYHDKIGIRTVEAFSSVEGVPIFKDHEYELVSVYDNPTREDHDAMAVMYIYALDRQFDPSRIDLGHPARVQMATPVRPEPLAPRR